MAPKRKSYSAYYKLQIVKYAAENGNRAAERKFGVSEKLVRDWRKVEVTLTEMKKTKKANRGLKARWPQLEARVRTWVLEQHAAGRRLSTEQLRHHAHIVAKEMNINDFAGGDSWCQRFMQRNRLSISAKTTMCQKPPADFQAKADSFREFIGKHMQRLIRQEVHSLAKRDEAKLLALVKTIEQLDSEVDYSNTIQKLEARIETVTKRAEVALAFMTKNSVGSGDKSRHGSEEETMDPTSDSADRTDKNSGQLFQIMENTKKALKKMHTEHHALTAAIEDSSEESQSAFLIPSSSAEHEELHAIVVKKEEEDYTEHQQNCNVSTQTKVKTKKDESESSRPALSDQLPYPPLPLTNFPKVLNMEAASDSIPQKVEVHLALIRNPPGLSVLWNVVEQDSFAPPMDCYGVYFTMEKVKGCGVFRNWTSLGEVKAIPLPMCVMVSKYKPGYKLCVSVVGKDKFGRYGPYSEVVTAVIPE